jgi:hypothetical protein
MPKPDAVAGHDLVTGEADDTGHGDDPQVLNRLWMDETFHGLPAGECGGGGDD